MKKQLLTFIGVSALLLSVPAWAGERTVDLKVGGMSCAMCAPAAKKALKKLERKLLYSIFQERTMEYLSRENLFAWLDGLKTEYEVFVPVKKGAHRFYQRYLEPSQALIQDIIIGEVRTTDPLKGFFTPVREKVAEGFNPEVPPRQYITAEVQRKIEAHQVQS